MNAPFLHELGDFAELIRVVSAEKSIPPSMVEKDYWVVHGLWSVQQLGWNIHFKGGTSLSKGYGIIERFSEDLDLKVTPNTSWRIPLNHNWASQSKRSIQSRECYWRRLCNELIIPGTSTSVESHDLRWRSVNIRVTYPQAVGHLPAPLSAGVLLELGNARVLPAQRRQLQSWACEKAKLQSGQPNFLDNTPKPVLCVDPTVTLLEKIDAICRHYPGTRSAADFVRHFEDAARIIAFLGRQSKATSSPKGLYQEMLVARTIRPFALDSPGVVLSDFVRNQELLQAWHAAASLHWGKRIEIEECAGQIRQFLKDSEVI